MPMKYGIGVQDEATCTVYRCLPHVPVEIDFIAEEQVNETGDVLLRTVGVGKADVIESLEFSCRR